MTMIQHFMSSLSWDRLIVKKILIELSIHVIILKNLSHLASLSCISHNTLLSNRVVYLIKQMQLCFIA